MKLWLRIFLKYYRLIHRWFLCEIEYEVYCSCDNVPILWISGICLWKCSVLSHVRCNMCIVKKLKEPRVYTGSKWRRYKLESSLYFLMSVCKKLIFLRKLLPFVEMFNTSPVLKLMQSLILLFLLIYVLKYSQKKFSYQIIFELFDINPI